MKKKLHGIDFNCNNCDLIKAMKERKFNKAFNFLSLFLKSEHVLKLFSLCVWEREHVSEIKINYLYLTDKINTSKYFLLDLLWFKIVLK